MGAAIAVLLAAIAAGTPAQEGEREEGKADERTQGPNVSVQEVRVRKNRPDEVFHNAGTSVTFWVQDEAGVFESILTNESGVTQLADDTGTDLIARHEDELVAWREKVARLREEGRFVHMGRSRALYEAEGLDQDEGVVGFYLTVESWALPSEEATSLHVEGEFSYVVATETPARHVFDAINLQETKIVMVDDYGIRPTDFDHEDEMLRFTVWTNLPLTRFEVRDTEGETVGTIIYTMNGRPVVEMPERLFEETVELIVEYREPLERKVRIDEVVDVGL